MTVEEPYGTLIETTINVLSWNVWGQFGPWEARENQIADELEKAQPDVVALQESWRDSSNRTQAQRLAEHLGYEHWFAGESSLSYEGWGPVSALISRWPIVGPVQHALVVPDGLRGWPGEVLECHIDGPRGLVPLLNVSLDWPPQSSALRQAGVRDLAVRAKALGRGNSIPIVVCGDFNAGPDSAELRMLTGAEAPAEPGFVLFDAWEKEGEGSGVTWDRENRWAAPTLLPSRRIDFVLTGWPSQEGGVGDVVKAEVVGQHLRDQSPASDHYGVLATLRY